MGAERGSAQESGTDTNTPEQPETSTKKPTDDSSVASTDPGKTEDRGSEVPTTEDAEQETTTGSTRSSLSIAPLVLAVVGRMMLH